MNPHLFVRDPESSELGKNIIAHGIRMIHEMGLEEFTFKKLAQDIGTTEASIYRYFENKHRLLTYITTWFWTWLEYQLVFHTNNVKIPEKKIQTVLRLLTFELEDPFTLEHIDRNRLHRIVIEDGDKSYLTKHVDEDNKAKIFKPYKDLCHRIAEIFLEYKSDFPFPHSLASTLIQTAHHQFYYRDHLPALTDFGKTKSNESILKFLELLVFNALKG